MVNNYKNKKFAEQQRIKQQEQHEKSIILSKLDSLGKTPSDTARLTQSRIVGRARPQVSIEMMMAEFIPGKGFTPIIKERFREQAKTLTFNDFIEFRHNLKLDQIPLKEFVRTILKKSQILFPQKSGISSPPLSLERFIDMMGG